jgi:hypothetical protein
MTEGEVEKQKEGPDLCRPRRIIHRGPKSLNA